MLDCADVDVVFRWPADGVVANRWASLRVLSLSVARRLMSSCSGRSFYGGFMRVKSVLVIDVLKHDTAVFSRASASVQLLLYFVPQSIAILYLECCEEISLSDRKSGFG